MWKYAFFLWIFAAYAGKPVEAILTDIEGTTTSISFVHDILFPYAKEHVRNYLSSHRDDPAVMQVVGEVAQVAGLPNTDLEPVVQVLLTWMAQDKKITPLKTLQGMMWKTGYEQGDFQSHVYPDIPETLARWKSQGIALYVYSSGSVAAQKLLFSHSTSGDLTPLFSGYFDTKVGGKKESNSYCNIAKQMGLAPDRILFLSDTVEELNAAQEAGMQTLLVVRDGATAPSNCPHAAVSSFLQVLN